MTYLNFNNLTVAVLLVFSTTPLAQTTTDLNFEHAESLVDNEVTNENKDLTFGTEYSRWVVTLGRTRIDKALAQAEGIDDGAASLRLGWEHQSDLFIKCVGLNMYFYSDQAGFSQQVENVWGGNTSRQDSDASAVAIYGELGYVFPVANDITLDLLGGFEIALSSERAIPNCSNCYEQDIDISSGLYVTPRISFHKSETISLGLSYQYFISGDFESTPMIWANFSF